MEGEKDLSIILFYLQAEKAKFIIFLIVFLCANAIFIVFHKLCVTSIYWMSFSFWKPNSKMADLS